MTEKGDTGWRLITLGLAWLAAIALHLQLRSLPAAATLWALAGGGGALAVVAMRAQWWAGFAAAVVAVALLAFSTAGLRASARLDAALADDLEGVDLVVTGVVASLPKRGPTGLRFPFAVETATQGGEAITVPRLLSVGWFVPPRGDSSLSGPQRSLGAGQRWRFTLRLRQPHGNLNPHGFDYELKLFEQGIGATASVRDKPLPTPLDAAAGFPVERWRQHVRDAIEANVTNSRAAGVLAALAVGDQGAIAREDWDVYRATGIAHLVAISGLHITMFAWLAGTVTRRLWRRSTRAMLWLPTPVAAAWGGLACAAAYAVFSGGGLPAQRTVLMLAVVTLSRSFGLRWPWPIVLLLAAVAVTVLDPWALTQPGFWLSFVAVSLLMASSPVAQADDSDARPARISGWRGWPQRLRGKLSGDLRTQLVATVGLTPLTLVFFQQISVVGFVANFVAIPVVTLCIMPLAMAGIALPALWAPSAWMVTHLNALLGGLAAWPGAVWTAPVAPPWAQVAGLAGAALLVLPLPWRARFLSVLLMVPMLAPPREVPPLGGFDLVAVDVGQGTAVLVRTHDHLLVFDTGPQYSIDSDAGERVLLPLLKARGDTRVDRLVLSHRDIDHVGGAKSLLVAMPVASLWSSLEPGHALLGQTPDDARCERGQAWDWDGVHFEILQPPVALYSQKLKPNALSCVLRVSAGERSVLLTGDIEKAQEAALLATSPDKLRSDLLMVPHHGSKTSSTGAFLDAVRPSVAVVQSGYRNRFGHPAPEVLRRYAERGIRTVASPACGAFILRWSDPLEGRCLRDEARRYWRHRGLPNRLENASYHE